MIDLSKLVSSFEQVEPAHPGHFEVGQNEVEMPRLDELHRRLAGAGGRYVIALARKDHFQYLALVFFVINDEYDFLP